MSASEKNINVSLEGNSVTVQGVRHVIYEMLYNIADNAIRYTDQNGTVNILREQSMDMLFTVWKIMESVFRKMNRREFLNVFTGSIKAIPVRPVEQALDFLL